MQVGQSATGAANETVVLTAAGGRAYIGLGHRLRQRARDDHDAVHVPGSLGELRGRIWVSFAVTPANPRATIGTADQPDRELVRARCRDAVPGLDRVPGRKRDDRHRELIPSSRTPGPIGTRTRCAIGRPRLSPTGDAGERSLLLSGPLGRRRGNRGERGRSVSREGTHMSSATPIRCRRSAIALACSLSVVLTFGLSPVASADPPDPTRLRPGRRRVSIPTDASTRERLHRHPGRRADRRLRR